MLKNKRIAVVGLGYVGLPLAMAFSQKYLVIGYDTNTERVDELIQGEDHTNEVDIQTLRCALSDGQFMPTSCIADIASCNVFIITVPTPVTAFKTPDLSFLLEATAAIGRILKKGDLVIYESTVYPGCTEDDCVPVLVRESGLAYNADFFCGYSPERVNPGDKQRKIEQIQKIVSASTPVALDEVDTLYRSIIEAGTFRAASIKVAEAAKAIENAQRDVNISFMNELALIFDKMEIDTHDVLEAAATKWNFLHFTPGLVGGHCIGVDPYYLLHKSQQLGYHPQVILSGRNVNDKMGDFIAKKVVKLMIRKNIRIANSRALVLGFTFKENCPDTRNTKVIDVITELRDFDIQVDVYDPLADRQVVCKEYGITLMDDMPVMEQYDAIILAVPHTDFRSIDFSSFISADKRVLFDVKGVLPRANVDGRL